MLTFLVPLVAGVATTVAAHRWEAYPSFPDAATAISFGGSVASVGTTMLGFMLAALAVLASINHTHLVKMMRDSGHYQDLLRTMMFGCALFLVCAVSGYVLLFGAATCPWFLSAIIGMHVAALIALLDVGRKLWLVLSNLRS